MSAEPDALIVLQATSVPAMDDYLLALGRATYNFTYLESAVVWLAETIEPGFLQWSIGQTAGGIANRFTALAKRGTSADADQLLSVAKSFAAFTVERNQLLHGKPCTAPDGSQILSYHGKGIVTQWTIPAIYDYAARVAVLSRSLSNLLHGGRYQQYAARKAA
jgi:hypothetical protein